MSPTHETKDWEAICEALTDITINRRLDSTTVLNGVQAFMMAFVESGYADKTEIGFKFSEIAEYWLQTDRRNAENNSLRLN
jgi:hypothetical protein